MIVCKVVVSILFLGLSSATDDTYSIPEPEIQAFYPRGFRVSIEDSPDVRLFAFHGNINKELRDLEAGVFSKDILHKRDGRWTFEERNFRLKIGDRINYWLFVIKGHLGYRLDGGYFQVRELLPSPFEDSSTPPSTSAHASEKDEPLPEACRKPSNSANTSTDLRVCEETVLNATQALLSLQSQVESLRKNNEQLMTVLRRYPNATRLTLKGRIPTNDDPGMTVRFILREKLDLNPHILSAERINNNHINFEVATIEEMFEILDAAKRELKNSKIIITWL